MPRPKAPRAEKHGTPETTGANKGKKKKKSNTQQTGRPKPGGGRTKNKEKAARGKGEAHHIAPERPARPTRPSRARARTNARDLGVVSSDSQGEVLASTRNSSVHRPSPPSKDGRYGKPDASVTGSTHANYRSARSPRTTLEEPARDNPIAKPRTGTTRSERRAPALAGPSSRHKEPGSWPAWTCPAQPPSKSGGASPWDEKRHHGVGKANRSTDSNRTGRGAAHQRGATRLARESCRQPKPRHTDRCQATTATGCRKPGQRPQHATNHGTGTGARQHPTYTPTPHTPARSGGVKGERAHKHTHTPTPQPEVAGRSRNPSPSTHTHTAHPSQEWRGTSRAGTQTHTHPDTPAKSGGAQPKAEPKHTHPRRTPQPGVAGYKQSGDTNTHTPRHPSQEWRGAAEARAQAHTPTAYTAARSGGVQAERAHKHTHTPTPQPEVAGRSRNPSPSTHTQTAHPSQE